MRPARHSSSASSGCCGTSASRSATACAPSPSARPRWRTTRRSRRACSSIVSSPARGASSASSASASPRRSTSAQFYDAKALEQQQRHLKYHDTAYNLEPNLKESPGGLRDLQTVLWIALAAGLGRTWRELAKAGLITMDEARTVSRQQRFIGALRVRLHYLAGRREDRLVFDQQSALARELGLVDTPTRRATEQLMQRYYRAAKLVRQVNVILLQNLHARLFPVSTVPVPIEGDFFAVDELLDIGDEALFERRPAAMLDAFLMLQRHPELKGMTARTLRSLWRNRVRIDARFRRDPRTGRASSRCSASRAASRTSCAG